MGKLMHGHMQGWIDIWMDGWMDSVMDEWMHACMHLHSFLMCWQKVCFVIFSIVDLDHISCFWVYENAGCQINSVCFNFQYVNLMLLDFESA